MNNEDRVIDVSDDASPKEIVGAFYRTFNNGVEALEPNFERYISHDVINHVLDGTFPFEEWKAADTSLVGGADGFYFTVLDQIEEGSTVATRWVLGGTHTGTVHGVPASGREFKLTGTQFDVVENGKIVERWGDFDYTGFMQALRGES